ncbi:hypothetical protein UFOVP46_141 [uncultured Caudovirales phage]|uniref:Uncharacterized protein n=1 Tax=uncultured Caudovirales phage TaxID=2100421 RepID=A0A6J5KRS7_9CAUD|nr:hypothetical protein UFOVP46_141 [uncultured Caudovirales phage]
MSVDNIEAAETAADNTAAFEDAAAEVSTTTSSSKYTAEDIAKARAQEKAKLYPQLQSTQEKLAAVEKVLAEQQAKDAERAAKRAEREAQRLAEKKQQEESELEVRDLLSKKEREWQAQLDEERQKRESAFALLEREREFQELTTYRSQRLEQERDNIIPTLIDLVQGNTKDEIEQSISGLKAKSAQIFEDVAASATASRKDMVGARVTMPASGPLDNDSAQGILSPDNIANMSMADYAKNRSKLLGNTNRGGQGLFGN